MNKIYIYNEQKLQILRLVNKSSFVTQRNIAKDLNISLGKVNFFLNEFIRKGLVKVKNFYKSKNKRKYLYYLTPQGLAQKTKLTYEFMNRNFSEYKQLKKENGK